MSEKNFSFLHNITDDDKVFLSKVVDWTEYARQKYFVKYSAFMDERRAALCKSVFNSLQFDDYLFWGGYKNAERQMLCIYPEYENVSQEDFPMTAVEFSFRKIDKLSHRDFLGALMSMQISRECVGDILVEEGKAQVFMTDTAAKLAAESISKIGRVGVKVSLGCNKIITPKIDFLEIKGVVSSLRLDCILSLSLKISREKASVLIKSGCVEINHFPCSSAKKLLQEGDKLSVRNSGKFLLKSVGEVTKKNKLHIIVLKYI